VQDEITLGISLKLVEGGKLIADKELILAWLLILLLRTLKEKGPKICHGRIEKPEQKPDGRGDPGKVRIESGKKGSNIHLGRMPPAQKSSCGSSSSSGDGRQQQVHAAATAQWR